MLEGIFRRLRCCGNMDYYCCHSLENIHCLAVSGLSNSSHCCVTSIQLVKSERFVFLFHFRGSRLEEASAECSMSVPIVIGTPFRTNSSKEPFPYTQHVGMVLGVTVATLFCWERNQCIHVCIGTVLALQAAKLLTFSRKNSRQLVWEGSKC